MDTVVITGAQGFIGTPLTQKFLDNGYSVLAISRGEQRLISHKNLMYLQTDIADKEFIRTFIQEHNLDCKIFIHLAWTGTSGQDRASSIIQTNNVYTSEDMVFLAKSIGCKTFVFAGSLIEYEAEYILHNMKDNIPSNNLYGFAKLQAHYRCRLLANQLGVNFICPLITNAYGPREKSQRFINSTIRKILNNSELSFSDGTQLYDFVFIDDVVDAIYSATLLGRNNTEYIIGSGNAKPLKKFIEDMLSILNYKDTPAFGVVPSTIFLDEACFDISALKTDTGYSPKVSFREGILKTAQWIKEHD